MTGINLGLVCAKQEPYTLCYGSGFPFQVFKTVPFFSNIPGKRLSSWGQGHTSLCQDWVTHFMISDALISKFQKQIVAQMTPSEIHLRQEMAAVVENLKAAPSSRPSNV